MYVNAQMILVETVSGIWGGGWGRAVEEMNSSMIYLTHFKYIPTQLKNNIFQFKKKKHGDS
jgi:hypothetical protein